MSTRTLLLFVLLITILVTPEARAKVAPYLEPVIEPVRDPVYEWSSRSRVQEVARKLQVNLSNGESLPHPRTFVEYLRREYRGADGSLDAWGTPLFLRAGRMEAWVVSAGPDRLPNTTDDIVSRSVAVKR